MPSIGNDIVDLNLIDAQRSRQARFHSKILAPIELSFYEPIGATLLFEHFVWLCWTVKEATYKFSKRLNPQLLFSPPRTVILELAFNQLANTYTGTCANGLNTVHFQSVCTNNYIHTVAVSAPVFDPLVTNVFTVDTNMASAQTHAALLYRTNQLFPDGNARIIKNELNIPTLILNSKAQPVSMAHHGRYGSFAFGVTD